MAKHKVPSTTIPQGRKFGRCLFQFVDNRGFEFSGEKFRGFQFWTLDLGTNFRRSIIGSLLSEQSNKGWLFSLFIFP